MEIVAYNEFSSMITDEKVFKEYDHIIFDTAPTGHTLLLLDSTESYNIEISRSEGDIPELIIKSSLYATNDILKAKASNEIQWINKVNS